MCVKGVGSTKRATLMGGVALRFGVFLPSCMSKHVPDGTRPTTKHTERKATMKQREQNKYKTHGRRRETMKQREEGGSVETRALAS